MHPTRPFNHAAPPFASRPRSRFSSNNSSSEALADLTNAQDSPMATTQAPPNSPAEDHPKVTSRLGYGWRTTFPCTTTSPPTNTFPPPSSAASYIPTFHPKTESKYGRQRSPSPPGDPRASSLPTTFSMPSTQPNRFDPFSEEGDRFAAAVRHSLSSLPSPSSQGSRNSCSPSFEARDTVERDMNGVPVCTAEEIGEGRNVYLPNLGSSVTEKQLHHIGQQFGRVVSVKIEHGGGVTRDTHELLPDAARAYSRTYAFVMFDSPLAAKSFMAKMHQQDLAAQYGKETPHLKQKALEDPHSSNLYVAEIPLDATEEEMATLLSPGIISSLRFLTDDRGNRRGTAMIRLQSRAQADEAILRLDNRWTMRGCSKKLQVRIADSEHQKQFKRSAMHVSTDTSDAAMLQQILLIQAELKRRETERQAVIDVSSLHSTRDPSRSRSISPRDPSPSPCVSTRWDSCKPTPLVPKSYPVRKW